MIKRVLVFVFLVSSLAGSVSSHSSSDRKVLSHITPDVSLSWIGQSGFLIQVAGAPTVISDPPSTNLRFPIPTTPADVVTISHVHGDHTNVAAVQGTPMLVDGRGATIRGEVMAAGMNFVVIPGFHDIMGNTRNSIITWEQGGIRFAQFGDYGQETLTPEQLSDLGDVDVAIIAISTPTTPPSRMKNLVDQLHPPITILSHFFMPLGGFSGTLSFKDIIAPFTDIVYKPSNVMLNQRTLPTVPQVWVMQPMSNSVTVNAASFAPGVPVAPGSIGTLFGDFTNAATMSATSFPLPTMLGNVEVAVGGQSAPLLYVSPTQINYQVSRQLATPGQALVEVKVNGATVGRTQVTTLPGAPGLFAATDRNFRPITADSPIHRGDVITIFGTGHGELAGSIDDGIPAPFMTPLTTAAQPRVTIGGVEAQVLFSGLSPGSVGLWQINVVVPAGSSWGPEVPVIVTQGLTSNTLPIAIGN